MTNRERIAEKFGDDILLADGFDDAIIGVEYASQRAVYSIPKMISILINDEMTEEEAIEYLEFNTLGAYVGEKTPIYVYEIE